jgi:hypothetical protein
MKASYVFGRTQWATYPLVGGCPIHDEVQQAPQGPDIHTLIQLTVGGHIKQLWCSVRGAAVRLCVFLYRQCLLPVLDGHSRWPRAAKVLQELPAPTHAHLDFRSTSKPRAGMQGHASYSFATLHQHAFCGVLDCV